MKSVVTQLTSGNDRSKAALTSAASELESSTKALADSLESLGKPPTPGAEQTKADIDQLSRQLSDGADQLKTDASGVSSAQGALNAVSSASATVSTMAKNVSSTLTNLKSVDAGGAWKQAFAQASQCKTLSGS